MYGSVIMIFSLKREGPGLAPVSGNPGKAWLKPSPLKSDHTQQPSINVVVQLSWCDSLEFTMD